VFLAVTFASSFVLFGVGTGFGGLQDIINQSGGSNGGPSASSARERIEKNPKDAQAYHDLSTALQNDGKIEEAIPPLTTYVRREPADLDGQRELAGLHLREAEIFRAQAIAAQTALAEALPGQTFQPPSSSKIGQALSNDPISNALSTEYNAALNKAFTAMQGHYTKAVGVYRKMAARQPRDSSLQFELAQTAELGGDTKTAIAAYKRFLALAPEDQSAPAVKARIKQLQAQVAAGTGG